MPKLSKPQRLALSYLFLLKASTDALHLGLESDTQDNLELSVLNACGFLKPTRKSVSSSTMEVELSVEQIAEAFDLSIEDAASVYCALNELC